MESKLLEYFNQLNTEQKQSLLNLLESLIGGGDYEDRKA